MTQRYLKASDERLGELQQAREKRPAQPVSIK
jgi:hypothetical protein